MKKNEFNILTAVFAKGAKNEVKNELMQTLNSPFQAFNVINKIAKDSEYLQNIFCALNIKKVDFNAFGEYLNSVIYNEKSGEYTFVERGVICGKYFFDYELNEYVGANIAEYKPTLLIDLLERLAKRAQREAKNAKREAEKAQRESAKNAKRNEKRESKITEMTTKILAQNPDISESKAREIATAICA